MQPLPKKPDIRPLIITTGIATLVLLLLPLIAWSTSWRWQPGSSAPSWWLEVQLFITDTGGFPWSIATSMALFLLFIWKLQCNRRHAFVLLGICAGSLFIGQLLKAIIKDSVQEPRPYVAWIDQHHALPAADFYQMPRQDRAIWIERHVTDEALVPAPLRHHWQHETGYAFPSGHTSFATLWAILGVALLWPRRHYFTASLIVIWAALVASTRMTLGMHWPQDLIAATLTSWPIVVFALSIGKKYLPLDFASTTQSSAKKLSAKN